MLNLHSHLPALIAAATVFVVLVVWFVPKLQAKYSQGVTPDNFFDRENNARKNLAQIIGGVFLLGGLYSSVKTFDLQRQTARMQEEGQITDRFSKAIDQLGSVSAAGGLDRYGKPNINLEMRLGGIYALERIASDSPRDHWTIMEVLTTYVRENSPPSHATAPAPKTKTAAEKAPEGQATPPQLRTDIQAILTVIGRRNVKLDPPNRQINLSSADLAGASLTEADFQNAILIKSNLSGSDLMDANLQHADLQNTTLEGTSFVGADLEGAVLTGADVKSADFSGADLSGAIVSQAQLNAATGDTDAKLPVSLQRPPAWSH